MDGWFVLYTRQHAEKRVVAELEAVKILSYLPIEKRLARHARQTKVTEHALIPRLLFVWIESDSDYHTAKNTDGVVDFLKLPDRFGIRRPWRIPTSQVLELNLYEEMGEFDKTPEASALRVGQSVEAVQGQWQGYNLTLAEIKPDHRANVTMMLFGKASKPFELDVRHLRAA
jgi:transcription antitermination factor NusG